MTVVEPTELAVGDQGGLVDSASQGPGENATVSKSAVVSSSAVRRAGCPPGWPDEVALVGEEGWQQQAAEWLLNISPPEYRHFPVMVRNPIALAYLARWHVVGQIKASEQAQAMLRQRITGRISQQAVEQVMSALAEEYPRLLAALAGVDALGTALGRHRHRIRTESP